MNFKQRNKDARQAIRDLERTLRRLNRNLEPKFLDDVHQAYTQLVYVFHPELDPSNPENYPRKNKRLKAGLSFEG